MKKMIVLALMSLSANAFAVDVFEAACAVRSYDMVTNTFDEGSVVSPVLVSVDEKKSVKLASFSGYDFVAKTAGDGVQATAIDTGTGAEIHPVVVDGPTKYSVLRIKKGNKVIVMDCAAK